MLAGFRHERPARGFPGGAFLLCGEAIFGSGCLGAPRNFQPVPAAGPIRRFAGAEATKIKLFPPTLSARNGPPAGLSFH